MTNGLTEQLRPYEQLLVHLTYLNLTQAEKLKVRELMMQVNDWDSLFDLMKFNKTLPISYYRLRDENLWSEVPSRIQNRIEEVALKVKAQNQARIQESLHFLKRFKEENIPVALLKGIALAEAVYENPFYKRMNDIDILVHRKDLSKIFKIYESLHYFSIKEPTSGGENQETKKADPVSFVAPVYLSQDMSCVIGTQWGIKSPATGYAIDYPGIWSRMKQINFHGVDLLMMAPEDGLHHLCLHLGYFKISVRDIMDLYNLLRHSGTQFNWQLFKHLVAETGSESPVYFALSLSDTWCPMPEVGTYLLELRPRVSTVYLKGTARKIQDKGVLIRLSTDYFQTIEKCVIRFNTKDHFFEKLRAFCQAWKSILWPPKVEVARMCVLTPETSLLEKFLGRIMAPYWVFWVIASEIGWTFVFLLILKMNFDLIKSLWSRSTQTYAEKIGVDPELLNRLQEHFE